MSDSTDSTATADDGLAGLRKMIGDEVRVAFFDEGCPPGEARFVIYGELTDHEQEGPEGSIMFGLTDRQSNENIGRLVFFGGDNDALKADVLDPGAGWTYAFGGGAGIEVTVFG